MASVKIGKICPGYNWVKCEKFHCDSCEHFNGYFINSNNENIVNCKYSKIPTFESPFKIGDMVWYLDMGEFPTNEKVRKIKWNGSYYLYYCGCKQTPYKAFATKKECYNELAKRNAEAAISKLNEAMKYAGGLNNLKQLLNTTDLNLLLNYNEN